MRSVKRRKGIATHGLILAKVTDGVYPGVSTRRDCISSRVPLPLRASTGVEAGSKDALIEAPVVEVRKNDQGVCRCSEFRIMAAASAFVVSGSYETCVGSDFG